MSARTSGAAKHESTTPLVPRAGASAAVDPDIETEKDAADLVVDNKDDDEDVGKKSQPPKFTTLQTITSFLLRLEPFLAPVFYTALACYVRLYQIDRAAKVVWDEAHFGKFGSYYIKHEFYHDVHPPLGKMLIGLSEWLAGFDGDFEFKSGTQYPEGLDFKTMRVFNALFSAAVTPVAYFTAKALDLNLITVHLITLMVTLEASYIALGKFILLDSILLFFTATTFYTFIKVHRLRTQGKEFTKEWYTWMALTGLSIGCVCSVKWVGLFVTVLVGLYTIQDLAEKFFDPKLSWKVYAKHWAIRAYTLILIPFLVYLFCFKIHFGLLYKSGTGDASTSSLFQVNLEGNNIKPSPRDVIYGSEVTIRSHGLSPNLLHSHVQIYPEGSNQQQITGYGHSDGNNNWIIKYSRRTGLMYEDVNTVNGPVKHGDSIRLGHKFTGVNLHSHDFPGHVTKKYKEVTGYGSEQVGDSKDDWIVEIVQQLPSQNSSYPKEDKDVIHPLSTSFRLKHADMGCYLATTGMAYPAWGFKQSEIVCKDSWSSRDKSTWWNVEDHINRQLPTDESYVPPKSDLWSDFLLINFAMASSNNALVPDEDKYDNLASKWWEWPTLHVGLRMCGWAFTDVRYFLIGNLFNTWGSTVTLFIFVYMVLHYIYKYQRQTLNWDYDELWKYLIQGAYPFMGWIFHFLPFVLMGRVTYVHHYVPALFFAIFVFGFVIEFLVGGARAYIKYPFYLICFATLIFTFQYYRPFHDGMQGNPKDYKYLKLLDTWKID